MGKIVLLLLEFAAVFVVIPLLLYYRVVPNAPIPFLVVLALVAWVVLWRDPSFDRAHLTNIHGAARSVGPVLLRTTMLCAALGIAVWRLAPQLLFHFVKTAPGFWAVVMLLYPLLSVYPQELIFRAYFFHRYQPIFGAGWFMLVASALVFGFMHIALGNWISVALSTVGGFLFALTYQQSGSLLLACMEHALFGNFIFTIGLGQFFYHGTRLKTG